eukprot:27543-Chlamydomonas_euryale.AAC.10
MRTETLTRGRTSHVPTSKRGAPPTQTYHPPRISQHGAAGSIARGWQRAEQRITQLLHARCSGVRPPANTKAHSVGGISPPG